LTSNRTDYNFGLIELLRPAGVNGYNIAEVGLPEQDDEVFSFLNVFTSGWKLLQNSSESYRFLQQVGFSTMDNTVCPDGWMREEGVEITPQMFCHLLPIGQCIVSSF
jgi:hypothetical protein